MFEPRRRPEPPDEVVTQSRVHFTTLSRRLKDEVDAAQSRVDVAQEDNDEDTYTGGQVIARAEENLVITQERQTHAQLKLAWEMRQGYARVIEPTRPDLENDWLNAIGDLRKLRGNL